MLAMPMYRKRPKITGIGIFFSSPGMNTAPSTRQWIAKPVQGMGEQARAAQAIYMGGDHVFSSFSCGSDGPSRSRTADCWAYASVKIRGVIAAARP